MGRLPALVIFRVLGIPDDDVARVKAGAESRRLFHTTIASEWALRIARVSR